MKYIRATYTKLLTIEVEDDFTDESAELLLKEIGLEEIFRDGVDWDDVEWDMMKD